ncbi:MAG: DUF192 domain-containing protein [Deltaproteobacteria bacterium]|nr:DUF192 domain-containing protein [Deltaproteobacteria bacterium]
MIVINRTKGRTLADRAAKAQTFFRRFAGLLFSRRLVDGEGLWIAPCSSVHTLGMRYPVDVLFLDARGNAIGLYPALRPNRVTRRFRNAMGALELPGGVIARTGTSLGDLVEFMEDGPAP